MRYDLSILCATLIKDFSRKTDDASVVASQNKFIKMHDIAKVTLQNEMDLILAHKRSMRLAELAGLSLSAQTTFATAVSEVARTCLESGKISYLILCVNTDQRDKYIVACLKNEQLNSNRSREGLSYAKKLVNKYNIFTSGSETAIELFYYISPAFRIDLEKINEWRHALSQRTIYITI